jgi:hypothetical protein
MLNIHPECFSQVFTITKDFRNHVCPEPMGAAKVSCSRGSALKAVREAPRAYGRRLNQPNRLLLRSARTRQLPGVGASEGLRYGPIRRRQLCGSVWATRRGGNDDDDDMDDDDDEFDIEEEDDFDEDNEDDDGITAFVRGRKRRGMKAVTSLDEDEDEVEELDGAAEIFDVAIRDVLDDVVDAEDEDEDDMMMGRAVRRGSSMGEDLEEIDEDISMRSFRVASGDSSLPTASQDEPDLDLDAFLIQQGMPKASEPLIIGKETAFLPANNEVSPTLNFCIC